MKRVTTRRSMLVVVGLAGLFLAGSATVWSPAPQASPGASKFKFAACSVGGSSTFTYPSGTAPALSSVVFNESEVVRAFGETSDHKIALWYNDEHALTLGVRQVVVKGAVPSTTNYSVSGLTSVPGAAIAPQVGTTELVGDQAGTDTATWNAAYGFGSTNAGSSGRPLWPSLFITDITADATANSGDWQQGAAPFTAGAAPTAIPPNAVYGTWKAAVRTVDYNKLTSGHPTITVTPDADPAKNNWNLGSANGSDPEPAGGDATNQGYGAEVVWDPNQLRVFAASQQAVLLVKGHTYRLQFIVHDGDQNKSGGDSGTGCVQVTVLNPAITLVKDILTFVPLSKPGQIIGYSFTITNSGNVTLPGPFSLSDYKIAPPATCGTGPLIPGASTSCTANYSLLQADIDAGELQNCATAKTSFDGEPVLSNVSCVSVLTTQRVHIAVTKTPTPTTYSTAGSVISYSYVVTNDGNVTLNNVTLTDDKTSSALVNVAGNITGCSPLSLTPPGSTMAPGASTTCTSKYKIVQADLTNGRLTNIATASGNGGTAQATATAHAVATALGPCVLGYPYASANPRTSVSFNESAVLRKGNLSADGLGVVAWYNDEHALTLGVRRLIVGTTISDFALSVMSGDPASQNNPAIGKADAVDPSGRPEAPVLFVTDLGDASSSSFNPNICKAGAANSSTCHDWQWGGTAYTPSFVSGSWKAAVQTITSAGVTTTPDGDPAKNNWNIPGGEVPPGGFASLSNEGYGAEIRWNANAIGGLVSGHAYRFQFMVHDGDQNKTGGDVGQACTVVRVP